MSQVYLEIGNIEDLITFIESAKEVELLKDISCDKVRNILKEKNFPVRLPIDINQALGIAANPVVRKIFGKKIEETTINTILKVANEG